MRAKNIVRLSISCWSAPSRTLPATACSHTSARSGKIWTRISLLPCSAESSQSRSRAWAGPSGIAKICQNRWPPGHGKSGENQFQLGRYAHWPLLRFPAPTFQRTIFVFWSDASWLSRTDRTESPRWSSLSWSASISPWWELSGIRIYFWLLAWSRSPSWRDAPPVCSSLPEVDHCNSIDSFPVGNYGWDENPIGKWCGNSKNLNADGDWPDQRIQVCRVYSLAIFWGEISS